MDVLFDLHARRDTTLVLVTHQPDLVGRCGRVVQLVDGRVAADSGRPAAGGESAP
jgi:putative ABC transport system ATP-binding protein